MKDKVRATRAVVLDIGDPDESTQVFFLPLLFCSLCYSLCKYYPQWMDQAIKYFDGSVPIPTIKQTQDLATSVRSGTDNQEERKNEVAK